MNNLLYAWAYVIAEILGKWNRTGIMKSEKNLGGREEFRQILQIREKMSVD